MTTNKPARPSVRLVSGHATTSLAVAQFFGRRHKDVLRTIENLKAECEPEFYERNFAPIQIDVDLGQDRTRKDPAYQLTRDGFTLLAMGFTGKAALAWKIKYIEAFNHLEARAQARAVTLAKRKLLADQLADQAAERRKLLPVPEQPLSKARYHYPRKMLDQPYFVLPKTGQTLLNISVLTNSTYVSPLMALLNQMRSEGHEVTAPFDEALAMRKALIKAKKALDDIQTRVLNARYESAEIE